MHDGGNIIIAIAALGENFRDVLQVLNRIQIRGRLFAPKTTVEVAPDRGMLTVPGQLTDKVDMLGNMS